MSRWGLEDLHLRTLPAIPSSRGDLSFIEEAAHVPFTIGCVSWIYDVPAGGAHPGRASRTDHEFVVALSGSLDVVLDDGERSAELTLDRSFHGLHIPPGIWRTFRNFSTHSLCLVLTSSECAAADCIDDYGEYRRWRTR